MCVHGCCRSLPDLPMLLIFDALPLNELLKIDRVCPTFAPLQTEALANRKVLTIFVGENVVNCKKQLYRNTLSFEPHLDTHTTHEAKVELAEHAALDVRTFQEVRVEWLKSTFPRVTKLRIVLGRNSHFDNGIYKVIRLLEHWAEKLESFGIWEAGLQYDTDLYRHSFMTIFALINDKMYSLQYLTIAVPVDLEAIIHFDLSFLGQLKRFSTGIFPMRMIEYPKSYVSSLVNLPEIRLFKTPIGDNHQAKLREMPPRLAEKITALNMNYTSTQERDIDQLKAFVARFSSLKWFSLTAKYNTTLSIKDALLSTSKLSHLTFLNLSDVSWNLGERLPLQEDLPPLSSLDTLSISGNVDNHTFLEPLGPLDRLFPVLKCIYVNVIIVDTSGFEQLSPNCRTITLSETVSSLMRHFAQLGLNGSLTVDHKFAYTKYKDEFNFSSGRRFEDWQYDKAKEIEEVPEYDDHGHGYDSDFCYDFD